MADGLDVDVPRLPEQNRKNRSADDVALRTGVVARVFDGEVRAQPVEQPRRLQERREVGETAYGGDPRSRSPADVETPAKRGDVYRAPKRLDEIRRLGHLQPERGCAIIHAVVFPFFCVVFLNAHYTKRGSTTLPFGLGFPPHPVGERPMNDFSQCLQC